MLSWAWQPMSNIQKELTLSTAITGLRPTTSPGTGYCDLSGHIWQRPKFVWNSGLLWATLHGCQPKKDFIEVSWLLLVTYRQSTMSCAIPHSLVLTMQSTVIISSLVWIVTNRNHNHHSTLQGVPPVSCDRDGTHYPSLETVSFQDAFLHPCCNSGLASPLHLLGFVLLVDVGMVGQIVVIF
jgi:hypothetical protein